MTVAAVLVGYAACVGTLGSRMLGRARWPDRAPLLAILTYLAAGWSVVAALAMDAHTWQHETGREVVHRRLPAGRCGRQRNRTCRLTTEPGRRAVGCGPLGDWEPS